MSAPIVDLSKQSPRSNKDDLFSYNMQDIDHISDALGIPWQKEKDVDSDSKFQYTGFLWNLPERTVSIPDQKKDKYLRAIANWETSRTHTLKEVQQLFGKLLHASLVVRAGRAYLTNLEAMLGIFHNNPRKPLTPPRATPSDLLWWKSQLLKPLLSRAIPGPCTVTDPHAYSDASSGVGVGIWIGGHWRAWRLLPGWKSEGRDIGWAEAIGFEFLVRTIVRIKSEEITHIRVFGDNKGVVEGWWNGRSRNRQINEVFRRVHHVSEIKNCSFYSRYVASASNPADNPSRGRFASRNLLLPPIIIPSPILPFLIDFDAPYTPAEVREQRNNPPRGDRAAKSAQADDEPHGNTAAEQNADRQAEEFVLSTQRWESPI